MRYYVRTGTKHHRFDLADKVDLKRTLTFELGKYLFRLIVQEISPQGEIKSVYINNKFYTVRIRRRSDGIPYKVIINGRAYPVQIERIESTRYHPPVLTQQPEEEIRASLPGQIAKIMVVNSEKIAKGQPLLLLEAMEMKYEINAPQDCVVDSVMVKEGDLVNKGQALIKLRY